MRGGNKGRDGAGWRTDKLQQKQKPERKNSNFSKIITLEYILDMTSECHTRSKCRMEQIRQKEGKEGLENILPDIPKIHRSFGNMKKSWQIV